jgi:CubicO group peptidase (beta-lactamase class C family)
MPTFASLTGYSVPDDRIIDGVDQTLLLLGQQPGNRGDYFYFCKGELHAVRKGNWKALLPDRRMFYGYVDDKGSPYIELYDLATDVGEKRNVADANPAVIRELMSHAAALPLPNDLYDNRIGLNIPAQRVPRPELPRGQWKDHGFTEQQRAQIQAAFQDGIDRKFIPGGAMMLIHDGEIILSEAFGVADLETKRPFLVSSPVHIASLTKLHTSTVLVMLAGQGLLSLDEPVDRYLPEFANLRVRGKDEVVAAPTLRQCLSHTTGFAGNNALKSGEFELNLDGSLADVVADLATKELLAEPGKKHAYSRLGYITAGRVAEIVTGRPFPQLMTKTLLHPVGAFDATFFPSPELQQRIPVAYARTDAGFEKRTGTPLGTVLNPGGRLISTLDDVARVMLLHRNRGKVGGRQLLSAESLQQMYVPQPSTPNTGYGLGFNIMKRNSDGSPARIRHTGAAGTLAVLDFENDVILIVLTQVPQTQTNRWRNRLVETVFKTFEPDAENP